MHTHHQAPRLHGEAVVGRRPSRHEGQPAAAVGTSTALPTAAPNISSDGLPSSHGSPTAGEGGAAILQPSPRRSKRTEDSSSSSHSSASCHPPFRVSLKFILICGAITIAVVSGAIAFAPLYTEASSSSLRAAKSFSEEVAEATALAMVNFVASPVFNVKALQRDINLGAINVHDNQSVATWLSALVRDTGSDQLFILYLENDYGYIAGRTNTLNISLLPRDNETIFAAYSAITGVVDFWYLPDHNPNISAAPPIRQRTPFNHKLRPYYPVFKNCNPLSWVAPFVDVTKLFVDIGVGGPIYQPSSGSTLVGIVGVFYKTVTIQSYMASLTIGKSGQALVYDAATLAFLGGTGGSPGTVIVNANGSATVRPVTTLTEPELFRVVLSQLPQASSSSSTSISTSISTSSSTRGSTNAARTTIVDGKYFVSVKSVSDVLGLALRVVVIVPTLDYTSDISYAMTVGLASGSAAVGALIILSAACLHLLLRPLQQLERKLYESASLVAMNVADVPPLDSVISELSTIDKAYRTLVDELQTVRSFLPQSVLRQLDEDRQRRAPAAPTAIESGVGPDENHVDPESLGSNGNAGGGGSSSGGGARRRSVPSSASSPTARSDTQEFAHGVAPSGILSGEDGVSRPGGPGVVSPGASAVRRASGPTVVSPSGGGTNDPQQPQPVFSNMARVDAPLAPRKVALVCVNLCGFHRALKQLGPAALHQMHASVVRTVLQNVNRRSGVVDSVHGDRFIITFNASVPAINPAERACETVLVLRQALSTSSELPGCMGARYGVATGEALCGNFGPDEMKRFSVIGPVVNQAYALMLQTKIESVLNLTNLETFNDASKCFVMQHVGFVMLPQAMQGSLISTLLQRRGGASENFGDPSTLGRIQVGEEKQPNVPVTIIEKVNEAFDCFASGNLTRTRELLRTVPREYAGGLLRALQSVSDAM